MSFGSRSLGRPSAEQELRFARLRRNGCHLCRMLDYVPQAGVTEIHHLTLGGKHGAPRLGHDFTIPLCGWHHRGVIRPGTRGFDANYMATLYGPSYALTPKAFRREYGSDEVLLGEVNKAIGWTKEPVRERARKSKCTRSSKTLPNNWTRESAEGTN